MLGGISASAQLTNGTVYWIQDVATGQFISQGDAWATRAVTQDVGGLGFEAVYISDGVYKLNNIMWNTVKNATLGLGVDLYVDQTPAEWTITSSGDGYTIKNGNNYLVNNGSENAYKEKPIGKTTDAAAATVWKFLTKTEYDAAIQAYKDGKAAAYAAALGYNEITSVAALETLIGEEFNSKDYTSSINNPTLGSNDTGWSHGRLGDRGNNAGGWGVGSGCAEFWNGCGYATQTVSGLPNGLYKVTFVGSYRPENSGPSNNLVSEKTSSPAFVYANDAKIEFLHWIDVPAKANGRSGITVANGYQNSFYTYVTDGTLALGIVADGWTGGYNWTTFGQFTLTQYYSVASFQKAYNEAMTAATDASDALDGFTLYATQKSNLDGIITANTLTGDDLSDIDKLTEATINLNNASLAVAAEVANCRRYVSIVSTINGGTNIDLTSIVENASFENGNLNGWTSVDGGAPANNNNWAKDGTWYVERWTPNGDNQNHLTDGTLTHDALVLPAGLYTITAKAQNQEQKNGVAGTGYFLYANNEKVEISGTNTYSTSVLLTDKSELVIKFALEGCTGNWVSCDNVTLTYVGEDFPAYTVVTGKMNAEVAAAQTSANEAFQTNKNVANYNALTAAIAAAQASKDAYAAAATAIANAEDLQTKHNLASASAITTFADAIAAIKTPYENNTLTTDAANNAGASLGTVVTGWHAAANAAAVVYMNDGFNLNAYDAALYVNTWSTEGEDDGSNFKVPFYEYFAGEGGALSENTWTGQVSGLENGLYSVSAWVRVRSKNAETSAKDLYGISMDVNKGTAVDVTEGDTVAVNEGYGRFQHKVYTAEGLVKDGILNVNFNIAADNNIHWLSFKNIKYTKVRDLTDEEAAVVPTALALYNGETEVTEPIALNATNNSVTLTVSYTPDNATEGVTWESLDENVATVVGGVVTGVAPGTTTIKATSTLDENVNATATVTVTYPETEVPASTYTNDGATRTVSHLGANLIKNGAFEYPNNFYGWTTGSGAAMSADNFNLITEDDNHFIKAKGHTGAGGVNSIGTGWAIEAGKTYVFGYKVKSTSAGNSEFHVVSLTNTLGTETMKVSKTETAVGTDWTDVAYTFTNPATDGYAYVQFRARWLNSAVSFDDFYLCEAVSTTEGNVDYATAAIPTANIGTGAFQYSQDAVNAANALVQGTATVEDVENAYTALTTINEPSNGQLFNVILTYSGWTYDQKAMTYLANGRNDAGLYNIQYKEAANKNLAQAFTFTKVSGNNYKMSQIDADGNVRYISTGVPYGGNNAQIRTTTDASKALVVTVIPTATEGVWNLKNTDANQYIGSQDAGVYTVNSHINFNIVETTKPSITINTTAAGWGTTILPFAVASLPEGVKAYTCAEVDGAILTLNEVDALEANKPYIIEGTWNEVLTGDAQGTALSYTGGLLTGVYSATAAPADSYVLQNNHNKVAFYRVASGEEPTVGANRCYLTVSNSARDAFFFGEETTAIQSIEALTSGDAVIYNAAGARIPTLQKGMNIIHSNGKIHKVIVK